MPVMGGDRAEAGLVVALLGPVEVGRAGGVRTPVAQPRLRVLLGLLGVAGGRVVTAEALVDGVWAEEWSPGRQKNLHTLVYQLRRRLAALEPEGGARLARAGAGYRLVLGPGELDVAVFGDLAARGREAARARDAAGARELFGQALGLWRGAALADAASLCPRLAGEAARLEELRLAVTEERIGADLALGRHGEVAGELAGLVAEFPLRERLAGLLITALYRCGRRGEALTAYDSTRRVLSEQLGLDPGPELAGLQARVLADDPALAAPAPPPVTAGPAPAMAATAPGVVPRQLPAGAAFFAGREAELKQLDALLDRAGESAADEPGGAVVISAVAGMAGIGKTALAVHWARKVAGRFPDGQLYVNLRGYDDAGAAVTAEEVTGWFLVALGVPAGQIPADAQARCGLYRSVLAGRRVLIVLDNARDAAQVRPLLPGSGGCLVVVTSRSALAGLAAAEGAHPLRLGPLGTEEGVRLLAARLGPERVAAEPAAVAELVAWCGHLPLALAVMAARAAADPGLPLGVLAGQLAGAARAEAVAGGGSGAGAGPGRLEALETGDPATSLRQLLSWSYRQLSPPAASMLALVGVHCGPDITVPAAASLAGVSRVEAGRALAELADASLAAEHRPGRYVLHDLVRGYAAGVARQALGETAIRAAIERSLDHYLHTGITSSKIPTRQFTIAPPAPGVLPEQLAGEVQDWARAEHQVVLQAIAQAAAAGFITCAWQLFHDQAWWVGGEGYWADISAVGQAVLAAAQAAGDQVALGWTHAIIGRYGTFTGAHDEDRAHLARALDHFRRAGDLSGQAWTHQFACRAYAMKRDWTEAVTHGEQALALYRQTGDQIGQPWALAALAECHAHQGTYELARGYARQALEAVPEASDPIMSAMAWYALGLAHSGLGEPRQAITCYRQALALVRGRKQPLARAMQISLLAAFGDACRAADELPAAVKAWQQAQQTRRDLGLPESRGIRARLEQADQPSPAG
jgi:DNA-binding SARP family transcriptional activator/tetratricopeptide (TPR) repeat protein